MRASANVIERRVIRQTPVPMIDRARLLDQCKALRMATDRLKARASMNRSADGRAEPR